MPDPVGFLGKLLSYAWRASFVRRQLKMKVKKRRGGALFSPSQQHYCRHGRFCPAQFPGVIMSRGDARGRFGTSLRRPSRQAGRIHSLALMGTITMSALHMFLPASEPARSEALAQLKKTHHVPRHLVRGIARGDLGKRALAISDDVPQVQQEAPPQEPQSLDPPAPVQAT
ncbi:hypothetical protein [Variovorax sp. GT1P44]|uniref:hypothetical protein n=1 Tax=Variovorax sp. GT1P44 TaxID=3443742 RepID=UPI003F4899C9